LKTKIRKKNLQRKYMTHPKVLITDGVHPLLIKGLEDLGFECIYQPKILLSEVHEVVNQYQGIIINSKIIVDKRMLDNAVQLKFIGRLGSGMEIIDQVYAKEKGVAVLSAPEGNCNAVAEQALGMLLSLANKSLQSDNEVRQFIWERERNRGFEIMGKTIALIGFGHTGSTFAKKLRGMDMRILAYDKYKKEYAPDYVKETTMEEIFKEADIVSFHLPLTDEILGLVDHNYINRFEKDIIIINTSRGKVIKTSDLIQSLKSGKVAGACLDVFENEKPNTFTETEKELYSQLYQFPNVILSPHVAGWTIESKKRLASVLLTKITKVLKI